MKQVVLKEIREQLKVAVPGLLILSLVLWARYTSAIDAAKEILQNSNLYVVEDVQPLLAVGTRASVMIICGVIAAALGVLQIFSERPRDRWAFFIHRPSSRTKLFLAKAFAGLFLYFAAVLPPFIVLVALVATAGHIAAPFEWRMVCPLLQSIVAGVPFYFAGMVCMLRPVRWFASRLLPLGIGIAAACISSAPPFAPPVYWVWPMFVVLISISALAAWGCFQSDGTFENQPAGAKLGTIVTIVSGATLVCLLVSVLTQVFVRNQELGWTYYTMGKDGTVYKVSRTPGEKQQVHDLKGNLVTEPGTDKPIDDTRFNQMLSFGFSATADFFDDRKGKRHRFFTAWIYSGRDLWYWTRNGTLEGYNVITRQKIGTISAPDAFREPAEPYLTTWQARETLSSSERIYKIDFEKRSATAIWTVPKGERIVGSGDARYMSEGDTEAWPYTIVITPNRTVLVPRERKKTVLNVPMAIRPRENVSLRFLNDHQFSIWVSPPAFRKQEPTHVMWIGSDGLLARSTDLPPQEINATVNIAEKVSSAVSPPIASVCAMIYGKLNDIPMTSLEYAMSGFLFSAMCAVVVIIRMRKYAFSNRTQIWWAIGMMLLGIPGLLTFLSIYDWPTQLRCPQCGKLRVVTNEECEHCSAEFAPAPKAGVEIFAPLVKT